MKKFMLNRIPPILLAPVCCGITLVAVELVSLVALFAIAMRSNDAVEIAFLAGYWSDLYNPLGALPELPGLIVLLLMPLWATLIGVALGCFAAFVVAPVVTRILPNASLDRNRDIALWFCGALFIALAGLAHFEIIHGGYFWGMSVIVGARLGIAQVLTPVMIRRIQGWAL